MELNALLFSLSILQSYSPLTFLRRPTYLSETAHPVTDPAIFNFYLFILFYVMVIEIEKRISKGRRVIGMLNSVLRSKNILHKTKKTHVPGFSPKYFTIWGRNMDTKHTTGEQITGN
jgi:hypothetical protein